MAERIHPIVPVLMYHSVADRSEEAPYGHLSIPVDIFNVMITYLYKHKFNTITLDDLHNYLRSGEQLPPNPIVLTFDDGYLDNWVNAFPILKQYSMKATIFVIPEFVDPQSGLRPSMADVWKGRIHASELSYWGFLSWNEMKEMSISGLIDIQSHSLTHTNLFQDAEIIDFHHPNDKYAWLAWNKCPDKKYLWAVEDQGDFVAYGLPIYKYGRAMAKPQYFGDESLAVTLEEYVKKQGGRLFFTNPIWKKLLMNIVDDYRSHNPSSGRYESQSEYEVRVGEELTLSKEIIERNLGKRVNFLCWPGGAFTQTTLRIAHEAGYLSTTKGQSRNTWGAEPGRFQRVSGDVLRSNIHPVVDKYAARLHFAAKVESYRNKRFYANLLPLAMTTRRLWRWLRSTLVQAQDIH